MGTFRPLAPSALERSNLHQHPFFILWLKAGKIVSNVVICQGAVQMRLGLMVIGLGLALTACSTTNEGASDIRRVIIEPNHASSWVVHGSGGNADAIQPGETVLVTIDRLFVSEFDELNLTPAEVFTGNNPFKAQGEIALLFGVQDDGDPISSTSLDEHVVVFYSSDTREGQFSNFRNQRVFGPTTVAGNFLSLEMVLLEIDRPTDQDSALFEQLASLGKQLGGATAGPTYDVLAQLGSSLLAAPSDDTQTRFRFNFDLGTRAGARLPLYPGLYAIVREDRRGFNKPTSPRTIHGETSWPELCLNVDTGELHSPGDGADVGGKCNGPRYLDNTYFVLSVERGLKEQTLDSQSFAEFVEELRAMTSPTTTAYAASVTDLAASYARNERRAGLSAALAQMRRAATQYGRGLSQPTCSSEAADAAITAQTDLTYATVDLHSLFLAESATLTDQDNTNNYDAAAYVAQTRLLLEFFGTPRWGANLDPPITPAELIAAAGNPAKFVDVFGDAGVFDARIKERVRETSPVTCSR